LPQAAEGEERSHGFYFLPDRAGKSTGVLGLPILRESRQTGTKPRRPELMSAITFFRNTQSRLAPLGELTSGRISTDGDEDEDLDDCVASCVDWYGNARPLFIGRRVFALMGYDLVEGAVHGGRIVERRRLNFMASSKPVED
jgi:hypothetical protein